MKILVRSSNISAGSVGRMTRSVICARRSSVAISSACCDETTTASMRLGVVPSYSTVTWLLPSGRSQSSSPVRRAMLSAWVSRWASRIGIGMSASVSLVAITEHQPLITGAAGVDTLAISPAWGSMDEITAQVSQSKPNLARV